MVDRFVTNYYGARILYLYDDCNIQVAFGRKKITATSSTLWLVLLEEMVYRSIGRHSNISILCAGNPTLLIQNSS